MVMIKKSMGRSGTYFGNRTNAVASELADSERKWMVKKMNYSWLQFTWVNNFIFKKRFHIAYLGE